MDLAVSVHAMNDKQFKQESENLDLFLKRKFCETEREQLYEYICSPQLYHPPYYQVIDAHKNWVIDEILTPASAKSRARVIKRMIKLAQYLFHEGNYSVFLTTLSALEEKAISRLSHSWEQVPYKYTEWFLNQLKLCLSEGHMHLLKIMEERKGPYIPHLLAIKQKYQKASENYQAKKNELGKYASVQREKIQAEMTLLSKYMDAILHSLSDMHNQMALSMINEKKYDRASFVHRIKVWQTLEQRSYSTSFLNRSLLLE